MNAYCKILDISVPSLAAVRNHPVANTFSLLLVALLENGAPLTLLEVAERFNAAGIAPVEFALRSLQRCRPDRVPVVRDGDHYALDPHNHELDFWTFRLGLRGPRVPHLRVVTTEPARPDPDIALSAAELSEAFRDAHLYNWSALRLAAAILDANGGRMDGSAVITTLDGLTTRHRLRPESARYWRAALVHASDNGMWTLHTDDPTLLEMRSAVRDRVAIARRHRREQTTPEQFEANQRRYQESRAKSAAIHTALRRVLIHAFPPEQPETVTLIDVASGEMTVFDNDTVAAVNAHLAGYDLIAAVDVRALLRALAFDHGDRRIAELGPPQKTITRPHGRPLRITVPLLVQSSCGLAPFTDPDVLRTQLVRGKYANVRRSIIAEAKALFALYEYGRLHGAVRVRKGAIDTMLPVPWVHRDEPTLGHLKRQALTQNRRLVAVVGTAHPDNPWEGDCFLTAVPYGKYDSFLVDEDDFDIDECAIQRARLAAE